MRKRLSNNIAIYCIKAIHSDHAFGKKSMRRMVWSKIRTILRSYLPNNRGALQIRRSRFGKPFCQGVFAKKIHFNISHAKGVTLLAICNEPIGVDIEEINQYTMLAPCNTGERPLTALQNWVSKEAQSKLLGTGLQNTHEDLPTIIFRFKNFVAAISVLSLRHHLHNRVLTLN